MYDEEGNEVGDGLQSSRAGRQLKATDRYRGDSRPQLQKQMRSPEELVKKNKEMQEENDAAERLLEIARTDDAIAEYQHLTRRSLVTEVARVFRDEDPNEAPTADTTCSLCSRRGASLRVKSSRGTTAKSIPACGASVGHRPVNSL